MALSELPVTCIAGVGPLRAKHLHQLGMESVLDVLYYFPFRFDDIPDDASTMADGSPVTVRAHVVGPVNVRYRGKTSIVSLPVIIAAKSVRAVFFNQPYLRHQMQEGLSLRLRGRFESRTGSFAVSQYEVLRGEVKDAGLVPIYRVSASLPLSTLRGVIATAIRQYGSHVDDQLPVSLRQRFRLLPAHEAIAAMHAPKDAESLRQARRRLVFEEFLRFQLRVQGFRRTRLLTNRDALSCTDMQEAALSFVTHLPFVLTQAQQAALTEILTDLSAPTPMHRLLQGDVGSGKTAVAFAAMAALAQFGFQSVLMAPTGILAEQHFQHARAQLEPAGVSVVLLTGAMDVRARKEALQRIAEGTVSVVIGTHAISSPNVTFHRLRLVVTDEQQRFGVGTRRLIREKGTAVDALQLSATPIPRTLSLTLYGDVAISSMRGLPPGRKPIATRAVRPEQADVVYRALRRELLQGHQAYVIAPRIEADGVDDLPSAEGLLATLQEELGAWKVGIVHGGLPESERADTMAQFVSGEVGVLVSTTIVEVGVSVPNATLMVIYGAERFGLSTLHQLRGRVGRSDLPAECLLVAQARSQEARRRLQAMLQSQDGFYLAEQDLQMRGPGEALGARQSGLPTFSVGDVLRDLAIMEAARDVARELLAGQDFWLLPAYASLRTDALEAADRLADS